jgi:pyruvate dehydrogenase E2 component (dihydrolipoamide acetyltransferase)
MAQQVILPKQGQSVETCLIMEWKKKEGDKVSQGEELAEVETDKAVFEVESPADGTLLKIFHGEGEDVPVLSLLALVGEEGEDISSFVSKGEKAAGGRIGERASGVRAGETGAVPDVQRPDGQGPAGPRPGAGKRVPEQAAKIGKIAISPRARRLAEKNDLNPAQVLERLPEKGGSGPRGRIMEKDVSAALRAPGPAAGESVRPAPAEAAPASAQAAAAWPGPVEETPVRGIRKLIADRMLSSLTGTAQYTLSASADAEALLAYRRKLKESPAELGLNDVTIDDLLNFAVTRVLLRYPALNSHFLGDRIVRFERVHLSIAVDTPRGLIVPVIRNASLLTLRQLAGEAARLQQACLDSTVGPEQLRGGTFTVSNLGSLGVESFTPVVNPPQSAILGVCAIQLKPVLKGTETVFRKSLGLSLTVNHQAVDGAPAARFLRELCDAIRNYELLLAG